MADLILDTGSLASLLKQYFASTNRNMIRFTPAPSLSRNAVQRINKIIESYNSGYAKYAVVASTLAFIEMGYKWQSLMQNQFSPDQLSAFLHEPPEWFVISPVDEQLIPNFMQLQNDVVLKDGRTEPIEWTDAVHMATAFSRDKGILITTDHKLLGCYPNFTME